MEKNNFRMCVDYDIYIKKYFDTILYIWAKQWHEIFFFDRMKNTNVFLIFTIKYDSDMNLTLDSMTLLINDNDFKKNPIMLYPIGRGLLRTPAIIAHV